MRRALAAGALALLVAVGPAMAAPTVRITSFRVLKADGRPIPGLYASGNATAPVVGPCYPGAGASIGPSLTFGYVAARHALGGN